MNTLVILGIWFLMPLAFAILLWIGITVDEWYRNLSDEQSFLITLGIPTVAGVVLIVIGLWVSFNGG